jgi:hypothetical protein
MLQKLLINILLLGLRELKTGNIDEFVKIRMCYEFSFGRAGHAVVRPFETGEEICSI